MQRTIHRTPSNEDKWHLVTLPSMVISGNLLDIKVTKLDIFSSAKLEFYSIVITQAPYDTFRSLEECELDTYELFVAVTVTNDHAGLRFKIEGLYHPENWLSVKFTSLRPREIAKWLNIKDRGDRGRVMTELREAITPKLQPARETAERYASLA